MTEKVVGIQPTILKWARESQGYSIAEVAQHLNRDPAEVADWETGVEAPTYAQLENLAYKLYKRPLAVFFLPHPPAEPDLKRKFRTLPDFELEALAADTRYKLRLARALQLSLAELNDGHNPSERNIFREKNLSLEHNMRAQTARVREYLGITLQTQIAWQSNEMALKAWRNAVEEAGVYVFKHAFKQKGISGFCLLDAEFPIIFINNSTSKTRQIFSLFHELGHLLLHVNGISKFDHSYIDELPLKEKHIEQFCNAFAAELLLPSADFDRQIQAGMRVTDEAIKNLASRYRVSWEVVLRRFFDKQLVSKEFYQKKVKEWAAKADREKEKTGGNYYATQATYLGDHYLKLVFGKHYQGKLSLEQVADYLGVKTKSVAGLENLVLRQGGVA
jgi:Zn-dependent peptidase ImmA (M78 family)/transcriptional regulator with XRE-family HTH domain